MSEKNKDTKKSVSHKTNGYIQKEKQKTKSGRAAYKPITQENTSFRRNLLENYEKASSEPLAVNAKSRSRSDLQDINNNDKNDTITYRRLSGPADDNNIVICKRQLPKVPNKERRLTTPINVSNQVEDTKMTLKEIKKNKLKTLRKQSSNLSENTDESYTENPRGLKRQNTISGLFKATAKKFINNKNDLSLDFEKTTDKVKTKPKKPSTILTPPVNRRPSFKERSYSLIDFKTPKRKELASKKVSESSIGSTIESKDGSYIGSTNESEDGSLRGSSSVSKDGSYTTDYSPTDDSIDVCISFKKKENEKSVSYQTFELWRNDNLEVCDINETLPLLHVACAEGNIELIKTLLDCGVGINELDHNGWPPLHYAICSGNYKCAQELLNHDAKLDSYTNKVMNTYFDEIRKSLRKQSISNR